MLLILFFFRAVNLDLDTVSERSEIEDEDGGDGTEQVVIIILLPKNNCFAECFFFAEWYTFFTYSDELELYLMPKVFFKRPVLTAILNLV